MVSLPQSGPQRSEFSAGTVFGGSRPIRFPRESGGLGPALALLSRERASAQWALRRRDVRGVSRRKHPPCRGGCGGLMSCWLPSSAPWSLGPAVRREHERQARGGPGTAVALLSRERASAQWALRRRDVRVVLKRKHPPCRGGCGGLMSFCLPSSAPWSLGPGVRRENEG